MKQKPNFYNTMPQQVILWVFFVFFGSSINAQESQDLLISFVDETTETFELSSLGSIKFDAGNMEIHLNDGAIFSYSTVNIEKYEILNTLSTTDFQLNNEQFKIYPNPSTGLVYMELDPNISGIEKIEIIDINGRIIEHVYNENRQNNHVFSWNSNVKPGVYYCRVTSAKSTVSKPIIIK